MLCSAQKRNGFNGDEYMDLQNILLIALIIIVISGVKTLLPNPKASKACILGYKAGCSFSPISTLILFWIAGVLFIFRSRFMNLQGITGSFTMLIGLTVLFLSGIIYFTIRYINGKTGKKSGRMINK
jgi:hypothetical protein